MRSTILFLFALAFCTTATAQKITDAVDRFTGERKLVYSATIPPGRIDLSKPAFTLRAVVKDGVSKVGATFLFASVSNRQGSSWRYLRCHNIDWLVDGKPVTMGETLHQGDVVRGGVMETIGQFVPTEAVAKIGMAQRVEYRVCQDEFYLTGEDIAAFKEFAVRLDLLPSWRPHLEPSKNPEFGH